MGIYIALGSNLPFNHQPPAGVLRAALASFPGHGIRVAAVSRLYQSPAWPDPAAPAYVNAAARVETEFHPLELLAALQAIETRFGRTRSERNAARTLDLDILDYDGRVEETPGLILPHPRLQDRAFVLLPLRDIAPEWVDPRDGRGLADLLAGIDGKSVAACTPLSEDRLIGEA